MRRQKAWYISKVSIGRWATGAALSRGRRATGAGGSSPTTSPTTASTSRVTAKRWSFARRGTRRWPTSRRGSKVSRTTGMTGRRESMRWKCQPRGAIRTCFCGSTGRLTTILCITLIGLIENWLKFKATRGFRSVRFILVKQAFMKMQFKEFLWLFKLDNTCNTVKNQCKISATCSK